MVYKGPLIIWIGYDKITNGIVAVKFISKASFKKIPELKVCVEKEIKIMETLSSPYVVNLLDKDETSTDIILIIEYCNGGDLTHLINK